MKNTLRIAPWIALCFAATASAHDFWVQPEAYRFATDVETPLTLQVGHGPYRQRSPIPVRRVVRFDAIANDGSAIDLKDRLHPGGASDDGALRFEAPGTYVVVLETDDRAQSHLPAIRFNDYLEAEGLTPALDARKRAHTMDTDGSESYRRIAKSIVEVGASSTPSRVTQPFGLALEIVPEIDPYAEPPAPTIPVRVIYEGRPLEGALVKLTRLENDAVPVEMHRTDRAGRAEFTVPREGSWLINVIWTRVQPDSSETDYETTFSSLSFGFARGQRPD